MRKIPNHVTNHEVRERLSQLNGHMKVLKKWHKALTTKAKTEPLSDQERKLLKEVITAHNNINKQFDQLTPSLADIAKNAGKNWRP